MGKVKKYKSIIGSFISSEKGQRFFNFAYSIGAAVVIWGALFKILHLPGGNVLLSIGMGTEVLMFLLTAFDTPPKEYKWEDVFPVLDSKNPEDRPDFSGGGVVINGASGSGEITLHGNSEAVAAPKPFVPATDASSATLQYIEQINSISEEMHRLHETTAALNKVSETLLQSYQAITQHSAEINQSATGYVEQMQNLNHNISGLNTIYEIQLKSVSSQLDAIDRVNRGIKDIRDMYEKSASQSTRYCEETEKMARYMQQLNKVYEKMIHAMTINMYRPMVAPDIQEQESTAAASPSEEGMA